MLPSTTEHDQSKALTTPAAGAWGSENLSSKDLVVPRIALAQASSNVVKEGTARPGQLIHSMTKQPLAEKGAKLEILPILCVGFWNITGPKPQQGFAEFIRREDLTRENDSDQWKIEDFESGQPIVRNKVLSYLCLLASDIGAFPYFIDFQGTNKNGGKLLSTIIQENSFKGLPAPARVVELSTALKTYKSNSWFVVNVQPSRQATEAELNACRKWYDVFNKAKITASSEESESEVPF
jgi:hypothetical protein